jgi:hypothetical protein
MDHKSTEDQEAVAKLLTSYQELITGLKSKLKHFEGEVLLYVTFFECVAEVSDTSR